jgi:arsenate reductase
MNETQVVAALSALAQNSRLQIFRALVVAGPQGLTPGVLCERLGLGSTALSFHLKELVHAGLVDVERQGRHLIYRTQTTAMNQLLNYLTDNCCAGESCLDVQQTKIPTAVSRSIPHQELFMSQTVFNVLFLCTHNSARSIIAEAILNHQGAGRFKAYSAGSMPAGAISPQAIELLQRNHFSIEHLRSKSWDEFAKPNAPKMDFVLTVCDKAKAEVCPVWPGQPISAHWGVEDPVAAEGDEAAIVKAHADAFMVLSRRIALFANLPIDKLNRLALQNELNHIGQQR